MSEKVGDGAQNVSEQDNSELAVKREGFSTGDIVSRGSKVTFAT